MNGLVTKLDEKKHTKFGKVIGWLGFLFLISGLLFSERGGMAEDIPEAFYRFAIPSILIGIFYSLIPISLKLL